MNTGKVEIHWKHKNNFQMVEFALQNNNRPANREGK